MSEQHPSPEQALEIVAGALREAAAQVAALERQLDEREQHAEAARHRLEAELDAARRRVEELDAELEETLTQLRRADEQVAGKQHECRQLEERLALDSERMQDLRDAVARLQLREKWAQRRRGLVSRLIGELRQRQRANLALKSGLDALRQFKNKAEEDRRALLEKYRHLQASVHRDDHVDAPPSGPGAMDTHRVVEGDAMSHSGLHRRLQAQGALIESMERDIQRVAALKRELTERERRIHDLEQQLEVKQKLIGTLEDDLQNTMRNRRLDPRKLPPQAAASEPAPAPSPSPGSPESKVGAALDAMERPRPAKQDTGTVRVRALTSELRPDAPGAAPAAGTPAAHALLRRSGE